MKKFFFILLFTGLHTLSAQSFQVEYGFKMLPLPGLKVSDEDRAKMKQVRGMVDDYGDYLAQHRYILTFTPEESYYHVEATEMPDDVDNPAMYRISTRGAIRPGDFYQNARTGLVLNLRERNGTRYLLSDSLGQNWKITAETKTIAGYTCRKAVLACATCKNPVEAWFTPEIPVPFGPAGYGGLPGLILELKKYRMVLTAKKVKPLKRKPAIRKPTGDVKMTMDEYEQMLKRRREEIRRRREAHIRQ